jgi:hypothetical protein
MERTYEQIEKAVKSLGFKWFTAPYSLNYVWERTSFEATNKFTDFLHICYQGNHGERVIRTIPATTKPGLKGSLLEPTTVEGIKGTAVIESPQQVIGGWEFRDTDKEFSQYPYFRQVAKVNYWRDGNKDRIIDKVQRQIAKIFGTHWHRMSQNNTYGSGLINNWSLGCMGSPEPEFEKMLDITRKSCEIYGNKVTGTIIESKHII